MTLPTDIAYQKCSSQGLQTPISRLPAANEPEEEEFVLNEIMKLVDQADGDAILLVDACATRHHCIEEVRELALKTKFPVYSTPMGKTVIPEGYERFGGVCGFNSYFS
jgi:pyruvate decarboxylase